MVARRASWGLMVAGMAAALAASGCSRGEVAHYRVPKAGSAPAPAAGEPGRAGQPAPPPGMAGEVPPPPAVEGGLRWTLPAGWTESRSGGMRYATLTPPVQGRIDGSVVVLPGPAGGELANVNRWRNQIGLAPLDEAALARARTTVAARLGAVRLYDFTSEGAARSRLLAGLTERDGNTWFVKLTGDATAVSAARADFLTLLGSLRFDGTN
jgi:hypothetical protein